MMAQGVLVADLVLAAAVRAQVAYAVFGGMAGVVQLDWSGDDEGVGPAAATARLDDERRLAVERGQKRAPACTLSAICQGG
jgi:hypothetical protein